MQKEVKMQDIADRLGISVVAVSKALSGKSGVSEAMRAKVCRTAEELNYVYNPRRKSVQGELTGNICVLASTRFIDADSFYLKYYKHISSLLQSRGRYAFFHTISSSDEENLIYPELLTPGRTDGAIILGQMSKAYIELITSKNFPVVFLDFYDDRKDIACF